MAKTDEYPWLPTLRFRHVGWPPLVTAILMELCYGQEYRGPNRTTTIERGKAQNDSKSWLLRQTNDHDTPETFDMPLTRHFRMVLLQYATIARRNEGCDLRRCVRPRVTRYGAPGHASHSSAHAEPSLGIDRPAVPLPLLSHQRARNLFVGGGGFRGLVATGDESAGRWPG